MRNIMKYKIKLVEVGPFSVPGIQFIDEKLDETALETIKEWVETEKCGNMEANNLVWFMDDSERDKFMLEWAATESEDDVIESVEKQAKPISEILEKLFSADLDDSEETVSADDNK